MFLIGDGGVAGPGDHAEAAAALGDEVLDELELGVGELARVDVAEDDDVVLEDLLDRLGEALDRAGEAGLLDRRVAFLGEGGVGAGQEAGDVDRLVADHLVLDVAVLPARVAVDVEDVDLGVEDGDLGGAGVVLLVELAGLLDDDDVDVDGVDLVGLPLELDLGGLVVVDGDASFSTGRPSARRSGMPVFLLIALSVDAVAGLVADAADGGLDVDDVALEGGVLDVDGFEREVLRGLRRSRRRRGRS